MIYLYRLFATLLTLALAPLLVAWSLATGKKKRGLLHHFGLVPPLPEAEDKSAKTLWIYALSAGEVTAAVPVLQRIRQERPGLRIVVSVTTDSGYDAARRNLGFAEQIVFHPLDGWPFLALALDRIRPDLFVQVETGFWPGFLHMLKRRGVPALLFHGRISKKSIRRYKLLGPLVSETLNSFHTLCMQSRQGLKDALELNAEPSRLQVAGDTKYDALKTVSAEERRKLREALRLDPGRPVFVAGSTHEGEEAIVLDAYCQLKADYPRLTLILAPRRLERVPEVVSLVASIGLPVVKRSEIERRTPTDDPVILLDTMGELASVYAVGDVAFVGKSLVPPGGGHSLIEPASLGKAVLHGPYMEYNQALAEELGQHGVAFMTRDAGEMSAKIRELLGNPARREELSRKAQALIDSRKGASKRMAEIIFWILEEKPRP
ncbi:MAG: hypothetical protein HZA02_01955 [Nitrospinae bacterium]|nr:hypothetical protein [Nitrospinota bacterium]